MPDYSQRRRVYSQAALMRSGYDRPASSYARARRSGSPGQPRSAIGWHQKLLALAVIVVLLGGYNAWAKHVSAQAAATRQAHSARLAAAKRKSTVFGNQVAALAAAHPELELSVATATAAQGVQTFGIDRTFDGASTGKLLTALDYLHHTEQSAASLQTKIDGQAAGKWLEAMIVNSDDTAWAVLNGYLTHKDLAAYARSAGLTSYDADSNTFTSADMALLLQKLYQGKLVNDAHRSLLLRYMAKANHRDYIVAAVPASAAVYHKIGMDDDVLNDAAIITRGNDALILVIFTDGHGTYNWDGRAELMRAITKDAIAAYL